MSEKIRFALLWLSCALTVRLYANVTVEITPFYDDRKAAVIFTADDWTSDAKNHADFIKTCQIARAYKVVVSAAIIPGHENSRIKPFTPRQWQDIQNEIDLGYVNPVSHSLTHPRNDEYYGANTSPQLETAGSKELIVKNLRLPPHCSYANMQYLVGFVEPSGYSDSAIKAALSQAQYLVSRSTRLEQISWGVWNGLLQMFEIGLTTGWQNDITLLNSKFDLAYSKNSLYHFNTHPAKYDWATGGLERHLEHISGKTDVWYAGLDEAYMYRYLQHVSPPQITATLLNDQIELNIQAPQQGRNRFGLSYPLTYKVAVPPEWQQIRVTVCRKTGDEPAELPQKLHGDFFSGVNAFRYAAREPYAVISRSFFPDSDSLLICIRKVENIIDFDDME